MDETKNDKGKEGTTTMIKVTGNTYENKNQIKGSGGRWNGKEKCWEVESIDELTKLEGLIFENETDRFVINDGQRKPVRAVRGDDLIFDQIVRTSGWKKIEGGRAVLEVLERHGVDSTVKFYTILYTGVREDGLKVDRTLAHQKMEYEMDDVNRIFDEMNSKF